MLINLYNINKLYITVTVARAVELKHNPSLISALANETSKLFMDAANTLRPFKPEISAQWIKYLELKSAFYLSYVGIISKLKFWLEVIISFFDYTVFFRLIIIVEIIYLQWTNVVKQ